MKIYHKVIEKSKHERREVPRGSEIPPTELVPPLPDSLSTVPLPFESCCTMAIIGPTKSGKSSWTFKLLKHKDQLFTEPVGKILYCYGVYQPMYDHMQNEIPNITFQKGVPTEIENFADAAHNLIILDDLMDDVVGDPDISRLFTMGAHHLKFSVIFITHNTFAKGKCSRTINLNTGYMCLFKNFRDGQQIVSLGKQIFPGDGIALVEAYKDATKNPYGYLIVDLTPGGSDLYRMRSKIFPEENPWVYVIKEKL